VIPQEHFGELVRQLRDFVKTHYSQYSNDLTGLVKAAFEDMEMKLKMG